MRACLFCYTEDNRVVQAPFVIAGDPCCKFHARRESALYDAQPCLWCKETKRPGNKFCSVACANKHLGATVKRKVDPVEFERLHNVEWLTRRQLAEYFKVSRHAINNVVYRYGLDRHNPETCKVKGCSNPVKRFQHCRGYMTGTLCDDHRKQRMRNYVRESRRRLHPPISREQRREQARNASLARWAKARLSS